MKKSKELNNNVFYVYCHYRETDGSMFYVGKGSGGRDKSKSGRNSKWHEIVKKYGYFSKRIKDSISNEDAIKTEIEIISKNRDILCNIASGGQSGMYGIPLKNEHKEKLRIAKIGKKQNPDHARKSALAKKGKKQPSHAIEAMVRSKRKKVINSNGEIFNSASEAARCISLRLGNSASQSNISMACRGERNEAYGLAWSYDVERNPKPPTGITKAMRKILCSNGMIFNSTQDAMKWVKTWRGKANSQCISSCARGEINTSYGFKWEYL